MASDSLASSLNLFTSILVMKTSINHGKSFVKFNDTGHLMFKHFVFMSCKLPLVLFALHGWQDKH